MVEGAVGPIQTLSKALRWMQGSIFRGLTPASAHAGIRHKILLARKYLDYTGPIVLPRFFNLV